MNLFYRDDKKSKLEELRKEIVKNLNISFMTLVLERGSFSGLILLLIALIMIGPAIILFVIALLNREKAKKTAKVLAIIGVVYLIISFGACGLLLNS